MSIERLRDIVQTSVSTTFAQIHGGRINCESEATLQLHLASVLSTIGDLALVHPREAFSIELEKPLIGSRRGRIDVWFALVSADGEKHRCAIELKFFKKVNHREPNNRYDVFKDIHRLERCRDVADLGFMLVATDHAHYIEQSELSDDTRDFDFRHGSTYRSETELKYRTASPYGKPIKLLQDFTFLWSEGPHLPRYMLLEVAPIEAFD